MSDTPETDAAFEQFRTLTDSHGQFTYGPGDLADHARKLERERNEARALAKYWQEQYGHSNPEHPWEGFPWEID